MFKTTKAKIRFVVIFSVICIIATAILIIYKNIEIDNEHENEQIAETSKGPKEKDVPGINLQGTYDQNDLKIEEVTANKEDVEIRYIQIDGLKNKSIQKQINKELEQLALNWYKEEIKNFDNVINVYVYMWNTANFANTLSVELTYVAKIDDNGDGFYQGTKGLNYDLKTGEKISIDKMFTSDAPIENILRRAAYYSLATSNLEDNLSGDLVVYDYGDIEDEIAEIITTYKKGKIIAFYYTPRSIFVVYKENKIFTIDMKEFAGYIAIYSRYLTEESLYNNDNIGMKNIYTLSTRYNDIYAYCNYQNEENYFIDISIDYQSVETDEFAKNLMKDKIALIEAEIEKVKQNAKENSNKFYILNYYISIYTGQEWSTKQNLTTCYEHGNAYTMSVHDFEENIEPIIVEYNRNDGGGGMPTYVYDFSSKLKLQPQDVTEYYNPQTGEKIVI